MLSIIFCPHECLILLEVQVSQQTALTSESSVLFSRCHHARTCPRPTMRRAVPRQRRDERGVATKAPSQQSPHRRRGLGADGPLEVLQARTWPSGPTASRATRTYARSTILARGACGQARAWSPCSSTRRPHPGVDCAPSPPQRCGRHGAQPVNAHERDERATKTRGRGRNGSEYAMRETAIHAPARQAQWRRAGVPAVSPHW